MAVALVATACGGDDFSSARGTRGEDYIVVGSGDSPESRIMASVYAEAIADGDTEVLRYFDLGSDAMAFGALRKGLVDVVPQPVGSLTAALHGIPATDPEEGRAALQRVLPEGVQAMDVSTADQRYALVVTRRTAEARNLRRVADLADQELVIGGPPGCTARASCLPRLASVTGPGAGAQFRELDDSGTRTKAALARGDIDVAVLPSTDGAIQARGWVRLQEGGRPLSPSNAFVPLARTDVLDDALHRALDRASVEMTDQALRDMVEQVTIGQEDPQIVAVDYLRAKARDEI